MKLNVIFLGRCEYEKALEIQYDILRKRQQGEIGDTIILVEHPPTLTLGRNAIASNIVISEEYAKENGITIYQTNRGGDVTYHGPGQIVGYPIINLKEKKMGVKDFVGNLEETFIQLLKDKYQIDTGRHEKHTGVWVGDEKILAIGIAVKHGVTMHGFAFNVSTNLEHFTWIIPCGISDKGVTSVENIVGNPVDFEKMNRTVIEYFCKVLNYDNFEELTVI
jgi:lipoyl(octanoyl) transferase